MKPPHATDEPELVLRGVGGSPGVVFAKVYCVRAEETQFAERILDSPEVALEVDRFKEAVAETRQQINAIQNGARNFLLIANNLGGRTGTSALWVGGVATQARVHSGD